ncbi:MAG: hypothetical protein WAL29_05935 [Bacteroidales bacterium]
MGREVLTLKDIREYKKSGDRVAEEAVYPVGKDNYVDRLFKYIPAELVAGYIFVTGIVKRLTDSGEIRIIHWLLFFVFCVLTPLYLWRVQKVLKLQQHIISFLSFVVWVFALGGPFALFSWYNPLYGEILLPVFTIVIAIWEAD